MAKLPYIYQNSRDAQAAAAENSADNEATEPTPDAETGPGETENNEGDLVDNSNSEYSESMGEQASPEEQAQYNDIVVGAMHMLYNDINTVKDIARKIQSESQSKGLANAIGQQTATILLSVVRGLKQKNVQIDPDVVTHAGVEVLSEVGEIVVNAGGLPNDQYDKVMQEAGYEATRFYGDQELKAGEITPEMQQQAQQAVAQAKQQGGAQGQPPQPPQPPAQGGTSLADMAGAQ